MNPTVPSTTPAKSAPDNRKHAGSDGIGPDLGGAVEEANQFKNDAEVSSVHGSGVFPEDKAPVPVVVSSFHGGVDKPETLSYKGALEGNAAASAAAEKARVAEVEKQAKLNRNISVPSDAVNVTEGTYGPASPNGPTSPNNPGRPNAVGSIDQRDSDDANRKK